MADVKLTRKPLFYLFKRMRRNNIFALDGAVNELHVPCALNGFCSDPKLYANVVNSLTLCDYVNGELVPNTDRTYEARAEICMFSPKIVGSGTSSYRTLYVREVSDKGLLNYVLFDGNLVEASDYDFVVGKEAAKEYAKRIGVCQPKAFEDLEANGKIHYFRLVGPVRKRGYIMSRGVKLYILNELNNLDNLL